MVDYKEKIRKLLALAESPVEAEARAALLKARQLMAEHKLTERECRAAEKQAVRDVLTDITCSKRREPWIIPLSATIGESYCCKGYRKRYYGQQTQHVGFIGLEDDVEICIAVFKYAVDCIRAGVKKIKAEYAEYAPTTPSSSSRSATATATASSEALTRLLSGRERRTGRNGALYW